MDSRSVNMWRWGALLGGVLVVVTGVGCEQQRTGSVTLARVGDAVLTMEDLQRVMRSPGGSWSPLDEPRDYVNRWVDRELLYQEAALRGLGEDPLVARELRRLEKDLMVDLVLEREVDTGLRVTDQEVAAYYEAHPELSLCEETEYLFEHIRVRNSTRAAQAVERVIRGAANFDDVANSDLEVEWLQPRVAARFTPASALVPGVREALEKLRPGTVSKRVRRDNGYEFFALLDVWEAGSQRPLEDMTTDIRGLLLTERRRQRYQRLVAELRNRADVEINLPADLTKRFDAPEPQEERDAPADTTE